MARLTALIALLLLALAPVAAFGQAMGLVPAQGVLYDDAGEPVEGAFTVDFALYADAAGETSVWSESQSVTFVRGLFTTYLGSVDRIPIDVFVDNDQVWLGIEIDGEDMGLIPFASVPYAAFAAEAGHAATADTATRADTAGRADSAATADDADALDGRSRSELIGECIDAADTRYATIGHDHDGDYSPIGHTHPFGSLTGVPAGLGDGDDDTLAELSCASNQIARYVGGTWQCSNDIDTVNPGDITGVTAGFGLTGGGTSGGVTLAVNDTAIQRRVTGTCASGSAIRAIAANGTVTCQDIPSTWEVRTANSSLLTGMTAGAHYLVSVYGVTRDRGTGGTTLGRVRLERTDGGLITQTPTATINWHDGQAPQSATFGITAPANGQIRAWTDYRSSVDRNGALMITAIRLPW